MQTQTEARPILVDDQLKELPTTTARELTMFVEAARAALGSDLVSAVLFGSAAESRIRPTSDVNLVLVLREFAAEKIDGIREPLRRARASIGLVVMFILDGEIEAASRAFAVKFGDTIRRHKVLFGADPFAGIGIPREAQLAELRRVLLNLVLRAREGYVERSPREEQAAIAIAELAGPLRACARFLQEYLTASRRNPILSFKDGLFNISRHHSRMPLYRGRTGAGCGAAFNFVALLPDGEVHACRRFPSPIGNARDSTLSEIYDS